MYFLTRSILGLAFSFFALQASAQTAKDIPQTAPKEVVNPASKADAAVIRHLHDLQKSIDTYKAAQQHQEAEKKQATYNEYAAKNPLEAKIVADQKEQAEASKNLSPANYDDWKSNKHTPSK
jgi:hypothetical protein